MAVKVIRQLVSDLSGEEIANGGKTVQFSLDNQAYSIDLTDAEATKLKDALKPYIKVATKVTGRGGSRRSAGGSGRSSEELDAIRQWANANGHEVAARGRIKSTIIEAYDKANG